ncbi:MAG: amino acid adenylation domain-containing protein [Chloroflexota bacterium]
MSVSRSDFEGLSSSARRELLARLLRERASTSTTTYPLSYAQRAMWFLHQLAPTSATYNVGLALRIRSGIDLAALQRSFQTLIARHAVLRTTFAIRSGSLIQEIQGSSDIQVEVVNGATWTEDDLVERVAIAYRRPFDLERGPILRLSVFRRSASDSVLLIAAHHIALDGRSIMVLFEELAALYEAETVGRQAELPPAGLRYADYVGRQLQMLAGPEGKRLEAYWRSQLGGELPVLNLPTDRPRPPIRTFRGVAHALILDERLTRGLRALARAHGTTLYAVLLAALGVLLHRYSGDEDILVACVTAGRGRSDLERVIGCFINTVPVRSDLSGEPTFATVLARVRQSLLGALDHEDFPFPLLVEKLQADRDPSRLPICDVAFQMQRFERFGRAAGASTPGQMTSSYNLGGLEFEPFTVPMAEGQFDLFLDTFETDTTVVGKILYHPNLFDATTIARMEGHFRTLLEGVVANPNQPISALPLLTESERHQLLVAWNQTAESLPAQACLHDLIEAQAAQTPDAVAVSFECEQVSYRELDARANQLARRLRRLGVGRDVPVAICTERSVEMVVGLLGILKAGGAYLPLDPTNPRERLAFMLGEAEPPVLLTQQRLQELLPPTAATVICLDADWPAVNGESPAPLEPVATPTDLAYLIYTSGSTGQPKGVMVPHCGIVNRLLWMQRTYQLAPNDRILQKTPYTFDVSVWEFFWPLLVGARLVVARPDGHKDPSYLADLVGREQITTMHFVPPMLDAFLGSADARNCATLRQVFASGEALPFELQERFFDRFPDVALHNLYGPTEASVDVSFWACRRNDPRCMVPIGFPVANTQLYVLDRQLQPVPIGVPGELHIGGVQLARGYFKRPELTAERFIQNPFSDDPDERLYKTGDLARYLPDGALEYLGRLDHQVKVRGFRIELGEIEAALAAHPQVRDVVVLAREDTPGDRRLVAYLTGASTQTPEPAELRAHLEAWLPEHMVPAAFVWLTSLPLTANGKISRQALPAPTYAPKAADHIAPRDAAERAIAAIWQDVLKVPDLGVRDNFFDLGGHSLLLVQVHQRLRQIFDTSPKIAEMFQYPTIETLAQHLRQPRPVAVELKRVQERARRHHEALDRRRPPFVDRSLWLHPPTGGR